MSVLGFVAISGAMQVSSKPFSSFTGKTRLLGAGEAAGRGALAFNAFASGSGVFLAVEGETAAEAACALQQAAQTAMNRSTARGFIAELPSLDMGFDELHEYYRSFQHSRNTT
jgi:hypothetical protein